MTTTTTTDPLEHMLMEMGWKEDRIKILQQQINTLNQLRLARTDTLSSTCINLTLTMGEYSELTLARKWYIKWKKSKTRTTILKDFDNDV